MHKTKLCIIAALALALVLIVGVHQIVAMDSAAGGAPGGPVVVEGGTRVLPRGEGAGARPLGALASAQVAATTVMSEGFEGAWPAAGWSVADQSSADGGEYMWGPSDCHPRSGTYAAWSVGGGAQGSGLGCTDGYTNNVDSWAVYGPFDLLTATHASLGFYLWGDSEYEASCAYDYLYIGGSIDGYDFTSGTLTCGDGTGGGAGNGYYTQTFDLSDWCGQDEVWVGFHFHSDYSYTSTGFVIDDVTLDVDHGELVYLTTYTVGDGSVDAAPPGPYSPGAVVTLTANAAVGWHFDAWSGDASGTSNPLTVTMHSDKTVTATFAQNLVYLPLVTRRWPPIPYTPVLNPIENYDGEDDYTVDWDAAELADTYTLEEDDNPGFSSPTVRYNGSDTYWNASNKPWGTYYYRVKATNSWGDSGWSATRSVRVEARVWVDNQTGRQLCYEVYGSGVGRKCYSSNGEHYYGAFQPGTYSYQVTAPGANPLNGTQTYPAGKTVDGPFVIN